MLNERSIEELINSEENVFRKRIKDISDKIIGKKDLRFLMLSGPTCSGKTTTAEMLKKRLGDAGRNVSVVSIDDFYRDRDEIIAECKRLDKPIDMDSVESIDLEELNRFVTSVHEGKRALLPRFDFVAGKRRGYRMFWPDKNAVYLFEGIQAVYPEITALIGEKESLSIYISIEKEIRASGDDRGRWDPRDVRLLRRLLRDSVNRGMSASETLAVWGSVVRNEMLNIEPYRDLCDEKIDSGKTYEIGVMKEPLIGLLGTVLPGDDHALTARLLTEKLSETAAVPREYVPSDSVLREFIGK